MTAVEPPHTRPARRYLLRGFLIAAAFVAGGNLAIFVGFVSARAAAEPASEDLEGIHHLRVVSDELWRGDAPEPEGYEALARSGVTTIVDLRAERDLDVDLAAIRELGLAYVHLPIRDGQAPPDAVVDRFLTVVRESEGRVYVHCGAGVGRTGTLAAAYLVSQHETSPLTALRYNLAVGPPSLEQIVYVLALGDGPEADVPGWVTGLSRLWDAPRRIYTSYLRQAWSD